VSSKKPTIAVIVPNYNDSRYLPRCLGALLEQDEQPDEIVIVDDASSDDSVAVIRKLITGHPRARLIESPVNGGTYRAFESALGTISSDFVLPLAANDHVLPGIFSCAKDMLAEHPDAGIWSAMAILVDEDDQVLGLHPSPLISSQGRYFHPEECAHIAFQIGSWFASPTMIYRRDALAEAGSFNPRYGGLSDLFVAFVLSASYGAIYSPGVYGAIRLHPGSFLSKTLGNAGALDVLLKDLVADGAAKAPLMFDAKFSRRFAERIRFSAIRSTGGEINGAVSENAGGWRAGLLRVIARLIPTRLTRLRIALAFVLLRPYDLLPTIWYRYAGALRVRWRTTGVANRDRISSRIR
jgi:hypothetical protein